MLFLERRLERSWQKVGEGESDAATWKHAYASVCMCPGFHSHYGLACMLLLHSSSALENTLSRPHRYSGLWSFAFSLSPSLFVFTYCTSAIAHSRSTYCPYSLPFRDRNKKKASSLLHLRSFPPLLLHTLAHKG